MTVSIFLFSLLGAMTVGVPIAMALLASALVMMVHLNIFESNILAQYTMEGADSFPLLAVPFFLLAGEIMNAGGLSKRIVSVAIAFIGHVRGGLGYVAVIAAIMLASLSGSSVADTAALGTLLLPMMTSAGYNKPRSAGLICSATMTAPVFPLSISFVIFGVAANVSVKKLFMAGIVPGLLLCAAIAALWAWYSRHGNGEPTPRASWPMRLKALREAAWAFGMPIIIVVGLRSGVFTPTEAAVVAAVYSLFVAMFVYRELKPSMVFAVFQRAAKIGSIIMFLVATAMVTAWLITVAEVPDQCVELLRPFMFNQTVLLLAIQVLLIAIGTAMDAAPTILIMTPILMPIIKAADIDPVYFGVLLVINVTLGLITPPVGSVLNTMAGVGKMRMDDVTWGVLPFMMAQFGVLFLLTLFPSLVLVPLKWFLPS